MEYVRDGTGRPGVFCIRRATEGDEGITREAGRTFETLCRVCFRQIGSEPFIEVDGQPKHFKHVQGG